MTKGRWTIFCLTAVAFLAPLKWGTPVVLQAVVEPPHDAVEWLFLTWSNEWGVLFCFAALLWGGADRERRGNRTDWLLWLPVVWLATQVVALPGTINPQVSADTVLHFAACVILFYAAARYVRDGATAARIFGGLALATLLISFFGLQQWFGGLEETRRYAAENFAAGDLPPDLAARLTSERVFGTLVYPNALAGLLTLAVGPLLAWVWVRSRTWDPNVKWVALVFGGGLVVTVLVLTGSRGGFISFAAGTLAGLWCCAGRGKGRAAVVAVTMLAGLFAVAVAGGVIHLGRSSLVARFDYWEGAARIIQDHPWTGTGPGTFGSLYPMYKTGTTEEAQIVHNNFLQMWSDSGVVAFGAFALLWLVGLRDAFRLATQRRGDAAAAAIAAGLTGWVVHGLLDFDLYVPGVAWPAFILLGTLQGLKEEGPAPPRRSPIMLAGLTGLVVAGAVWLTGRSLLAAHWHGEQHRLQQVNPTGALAIAQRVINLAPWNSHYLSQAGELAAQLGRFDEATGFYRRAIARDPYRASHHWRLARVLWMEGNDVAGALQSLRRAVELNPTKKTYVDSLAAAEESVRQGGGRLLESAPNR